MTGQELKVLQLVAEGLTNPEIGERLSLSRHTVKEYFGHVMRKLEVNNRVEAVIEASRLGLIESPGSGEAAEPSEESADTGVPLGDLDPDSVNPYVDEVVPAASTSPRGVKRARPSYTSLVEDSALLRRLSAAGVLFTVVFIAVYLILTW